MFNRYIAHIAFLFLFPAMALGQNCSFEIMGTVNDLSTGHPIEYANIYVKELGKGAVSDSLGFFSIASVCEGHYHLSISHIGCKTQDLYLMVDKDTSLNLLMDHSSQLLDAVVIKKSKTKNTTQEMQSLNSKSITEGIDKNLGSILENIPGVSSIKNGTGISKPVVHGLYGNRLAILNNGIAQNGQQWGIDHSPEIDPLVANSIAVIKGVGTLEYPGRSLGSVILVEPKKIREEPHLHGEARYFLESNGRGNGLNLDLQQHSPWMAWRIVGTLKKSGDRRSSDYFLNNTGSEEANIAMQLERSWNDKWSSEIYLSSFNAKLGILRGSHIGNLTDLEEALEREIPFYTEDEFSYAIESPFQQVNHHLLKAHSKFKLDESQWMDLTYSFQYNSRKEFDVRRSGRSDIPALSLEQISNYFEAKYQKLFKSDLSLKLGIQLNSVDNTNIPETGILPLIPDYFQLESGLYGILTKRFNKTKIEFGARYDNIDRNVAAISMSLPREIIRYDNKYHNITTQLGILQDIAKNWKLSYNIGYTSRNPEVNVLYSNGLHQGVSGIEEGDPDLSKEVSIKNTFSVKGTLLDKFFIDALWYYQNIKDYIFLDPQDEFRLTIRGAFPVFKYEQTNASLKGLDLSLIYQVTERMNIISKYSYLQGSDLSNSLPLIYMPSNNIYASINYHIPAIGGFENLELQLNNRYVFEQTNLEADQDYSAPPKAYNLLGAKISLEKQLKSLRLKTFLKVDNLLNISYREYLNRQRYFADDLGLNLILGLNISF